MKKICNKAFGDQAASKKAIAERGCFPPNRVLLKHASLAKDNEEAGACKSLNTEVGFAAATLDKLLDHRSRSEGRKRAVEKRNATSAGVVKDLVDTKRLTASVITSRRVHSLDDPRLHEALAERDRIRKEKEEKSAKTKRDKIKKVCNGVREMREKWGHESLHRFEPCNLKECGAYLQYKKDQGKGNTKDGAMPKGVEERRARCVAWMERPSPVGTPCNSDDEDDGANEGVSALLSLAAARVGVEENQGELEDLEMFGIIDEYGEVSEDHQLSMV